MQGRSFRAPLSATILLTLLAAGCSRSEAPVRTQEYAVQGAFTGAISPSARYALVGSIQHGGSLWDIQQQERLYNWNHQKGRFSELVAADFSPEGQYAVTAGPRNLVLWEVSGGAPHWFWNAPGGILDVELASNGSAALLGLDDHTAVYFDIKNGGLLQTLRHDGRVRAVALSEDGTKALTGSDDNQAKLWDLQQGTLLRGVTHENNVNTVALSPNGKVAFSAGQLEKALLWDTENGRTLHTLTSDERYVPQRISYTAAVFSPTSDRLLTGTSSGLVQLWDVRQGRELKRWQAAKRDPLRPTSAHIYALGFGNGNYYALASNGLLNQLR